MHAWAYSMYVARRVDGRADRGVKGASVMATARTFKVGPRALLAGDGGLLMAGACAVLAPLAFLNEGATIPLMLVGLLAPMLAWWVHGRLVDGTATLGAVLGVVAGAAIAVALLLLGALVQKPPMRRWSGG